MRLGRLVAAGLVAGAVAGFVGALLRPRTVQTYRRDTDRPATDARGDLAAVRSLAVPESRALQPLSAPGDATGSHGYALATSARDETTEGLPEAATGTTTGRNSVASGVSGDDPAGHDPRTLDVDALPAEATPVAVAPSRGANG